MPSVGEVAARGGEVLTRNTASETGASTGEMARADTADVSTAAKATDVSTAAKPTDASATEPAAYMSASAEPASMSTTETAAMATAATMSTATTSAARKRVSGQSGGESGSSQEDDHRLT
jgi:hypothetical protein